MAEGEALILLAKGDGPEEFIVIEKSPFTVGRRPDNDMQIAQKDVSGMHAQLCHVAGAWWVVDNGSTNGTFLNGNRIQGKAQLNIKDILHFASKGFEVVPDVEEEEEEEPAAMSTQVLGDSSDIRGMVDLVNIVSDQRTFPLWQPIIDLINNRDFGWEALGRGVSSDGPTPPGQLFRLASQNNVEVKLSQRFRESAIGCATCRHCWPALEKPYLFFNLHPDEVKEDLYDLLIKNLSSPDLLKDYRVTLEIHESLVCNTDEMMVMCGKARDAGLYVAYDDFGAGQSRIPDLIGCPPDFLKLDRSLVSGLGTEKVKSGIVKALVDACKELKVMCLAEGIETQEELDVCNDMKVELGQGYFLCRPKSPFFLFEKDETKLPADKCPFVRLNIVSHYSAGISGPPPS